LCKELLLELSYYDLENRTNSIMGPERKERSNKVQIDNIIYVPLVQNRGLKIGANTSSNNGHDYWTTLVFSNIVYVKEKEPTDFVFKANDNKEYIIERVPRNTQVKVSCSCLDFHYRFAVWDDQHRALDGNPPPPYTRTSNRPPVNPFKTPGLCKHIIAIVDKLQNENFFA
jgi:hypothetical protein